MAMPTYPLQALLTVRHFREEGAKNAVRAAERVLAELQEDIVKKQQELEDFRRWLPEEINRRYMAVLGKSLSTGEVADFRSSISALTAREETYILAVKEAEKKVRQQEKAVIKAREAVAEARKEAAKIEAHRDIWKVEAKKEAERQEDLEMEEFKAPAQQSDES